MDGNYKCDVVTKIMDGWKLVTVNVKNADKLMDLFKDRHTHFGLILF